MPGMGSVSLGAPLERTLRVAVRLTDHLRAAGGGGVEPDPDLVGLGDAGDGGVIDAVFRGERAHDVGPRRR